MDSTPKQMKGWKVIKENGQVMLAHSHPEEYNKDSHWGVINPGYKEVVYFGNDKWKCYFCHAEPPEEIAFIAELAGCQRFKAYIDWLKKQRPTPFGKVK